MLRARILGALSLAGHPRLYTRSVRFFRLAPNTTTCIAVLPSPRPGLPAAVVITVRVARGQRCPT